MNKKLHKKNTKKKAPKKTSNKRTFSAGGELPVKYLLHHLSCPISIFDYRKKRFVYVNGPFTQLTGLKAADCIKMSLEDFLRCVESYDLLGLQNEIKENLMVVCKKYIRSKHHQLTYTMNCRFRQKDGTFNDIIVQCSVIEWDENNYPAVTLNLYTNLSPHKRDLKVVFTVSIFDEGEKQWKTVVTKEFLRKPSMLSDRELGVMKLITRDLSAEEIAENLGMKFYTVRSHWRNILSKTGCKSQKELKEMALHEGWV